MSLPGNDKEHREFGANFQLSASNLHILGQINSASKLGDEEFWLLRALWPKLLDIRGFDAGQYGFANEFQQAGQILNAASSFPAYLGSIAGNAAITPDGPNDPHPLGRFEIVRSDQLEIIRLGETPDRSSHVFVAPATPVATRTRNGLQQQQQQQQQLEQQPPAYDEQTVNTGALSYLKAITMKIDGIRSRWVDRRFKLQAEFGRATLIAILDGSLNSNQDNRIQALVEVKPRHRSSNTKQIQKQETAQMVSWIVNQPHTPGWGTSGRHLLVSQDKDEIYLIFGTYSHRYYEFVKGTTKTTRDYLKMQQYGPWKIYKAQDMSHLAQIIVGFLLRARDGL